MGRDCGHAQYYRRTDGSCIACERAVVKSDEDMLAEAVDGAVKNGHGIVFAGKLSRLVGGGGPWT